MTAPASPAPTEMPPGFRGVFRHDALARGMSGTACAAAQRTNITRSSVSAGTATARGLMRATPAASL
ncbi:MAG: hypothetical protein ACKOFO_01290 [Gemmatimonadota bacterium]